jgi:hypothetical protein
MTDAKKREEMWKQITHDIGENHDLFHGGHSQQECVDFIEKLLAVARAAKEVNIRYKDPYTTQIRTHAAILEMAKALAALEAKP